MSTFRFLHVEFIHVIWGVILVTLALVILELWGHGVLDRLMTRLMQTRLVHRVPTFRRITAILLVMVAMVLLVFALMRPQWGATIQQAIRVDSQVMICLDVSKSMLAEDVAPSRMERAKAEIDALLGLMDQGQQVGLIAFAGKATVLCPMTTDFGFLRMVLRETRPDSVGLGGTKIGLALKKAVDGFGSEGDINRLILLITDGEDHDSFPIEAAKQASQKGIKIVCVGFGDPSGSKIEITDSATGVRSFLKDSSGNDVVSRLDRETLCDIAEETKGAYVPAETGALDLESIYKVHIATLLHGSSTMQSRVVRNEAFQWFVLAALFFLLVGLVVATPLNLRMQAAQSANWKSADVARQAGMILFVLSVSLLPRSVVAQPSSGRGGTKKVVRQVQPGSPHVADAVQDAAHTAEPSTNHAGEKAAKTERESDLPPRVAYNQAVVCIQSDPEEAGRLLAIARRDAGGDGELRFRALYNLGWVEVERADQQLKDEPKKALQHLQQAANRFREAIRLRPASSNARQNLEIISRRILQLSASLNKKDPRKLEERLDELIRRIREQQSELGQMIQRISATAENPEAYRREFRRLGVAQRQIISDSQRFVEDARKESDAIKQKPENDRTPRQQLRTVQISNMLLFIDRAIQRMNKTRSLTRRLSGAMAFRRWSAALADAKRGRDQLRHPVEVIGQILADASEMMQLTGALASAKTVLEQNGSQQRAPAWLTTDYLAELQADVLERTSEIDKTINGIVAQAELSEQAPAATQNPPKKPDPEMKRLVANMKTARPLIEKAVAVFEKTSDLLKSDKLKPAYQQQPDGVQALADAWELFFDIRRLIEVTYQDEIRVQRAVSHAVKYPPLAEQAKSALSGIQKKNAARCERLDRLIDAERQKLQQQEASAKHTQVSGGPVPSTTQSDQKASKSQTQRLRRAKATLGRAVVHLQRSVKQLDNLQAKNQPSDSKPLPASDQPAKPMTKRPVQNSAREAMPSEDADKTPKHDPTKGSKPEIAGRKATGSKPDRSDLVESKADEQKSKSDVSRKSSGAAGSRAADSGGDSNRPSEREAEDRPLAEVETSVDAAVGELESLRRLFFSLIEHLRDTARRQMDLRDATAKLNPNPDQAVATEKIGPLVGRQKRLQGLADQIAQALTGQSEQARKGTSAPSQTPGSTVAPEAKRAQQTAEKLDKAAKLVDAAGSTMGQAVNKLDEAAKPDSEQDKRLSAALTSQDDSLQKLAEAIALLDQQQKNDQNKQQNQQDKEQQQQEQEKDKQQKQQQRNMSAQQLLQAIRDREAERRKRKHRPAASAGTVGKDW